MRLLIPAGLISLLFSAAVAAPSAVTTSLDGVPYASGLVVKTQQVVVDGVTKTLKYYGTLQPAARPRRRDVLYIDGNSNQHFDKCGASTFVSNTTGFSAAVADCQCIVSGVNQEGGYWFARPVDGLQFNTQLVSCNSCAFTISSADSYGAYVGDTDIRDLINDSITKFGATFNINGEDTQVVGAQGVMPCSNDEDQAQTTWHIIHIGN